MDTNTIIVNSLCEISDIHSILGIIFGMPVGVVLTYFVTYIHSKIKGE